jgi:hypothetical protein
MVQLPKKGLEALQRRYMTHKPADSCLRTKYYNAAPEPPQEGHSQELTLERLWMLLDSQ